MKKYYEREKPEGDNPVLYMVVATKADLPTRQVSYEEAAQYAESIGAFAYVECSAKENINVDEIFLTVGCSLVRKDLEKMGSENLPEERKLIKIPSGKNAILVPEKPSPAPAANKRTLPTST
jgi:GTPase SAR1 family protein